MSSTRLRRLLAVAALAIPLAAAPAATAAARAEPQVVPQYRVYQLNLCNSGSAGCFDKKRDHEGHQRQSDEDLAAMTMDEAVYRVQQLATPPDVITINEICEQDLDGLKQRLGFDGVEYRGDSFFPVMSRKGGALPCADTRGSTRYGSAIITRDAMPEPYSEHRLWRPFVIQDERFDELRSMGCRKMDGFTACTAQLLNLADHTDPDDPARPTTEAQCKELVEESVSFADGQPLIIAGDLNLKWSADAAEDQKSLQRCLDVADNLTRKGDGDVQHVITTMDFLDVGAGDQPEWITDHPPLWAKLQ
jgi:hypothetical protein